MQFWVTPSSVLRTAGEAHKPLNHQLPIYRVAAAFCLVVALSWAMSGMKAHALGWPFEVASASLGFWLLAIISWWNRKKGGRFDPFEFPTWISINLYIQVVANIWLLQRDYVVRVPWLRGNYDFIMPIVVSLFGVSLTAMWIGYVWAYSHVGTNRKKVLRPLQFNQSATLVVWYTGSVASIFSVIIAGQSYLGTASQESLAWTNYSYFILLLTNTAATALAMNVFRAPSPSGWIWLIASLTLSFALALFVGSKGFAMVMIWLLMYYYYARGKFPRRWVPVGLVLLILYVPTINTYRAKLHSIEVGSGVETSDRLQSLGSALNEVLSSPLNGLAENTSETFQARQGSFLEVTASVMTLHPSERPYMGDEMLEFLLPSLVPRILWPDKPTERWPMYFATTTYMAAKNEHTFTAIGLVADCYRAGGWLFAVVFFASLGILGAKLYKSGPGSGEFAGTVFYLFMITSILVLEPELLTLLIRLVSFVPLIWLIVRFLFFQRAVGSTPQ